MWVVFVILEMPRFEYWIVLSACDGNAYPAEFHLFHMEEFAQMFVKTAPTCYILKFGMNSSQRVNKIYMIISRNTSGKYANKDIQIFDSQIAVDTVREMMVNDNQLHVLQADIVQLPAKL